MMHLSPDSFSERRRQILDGIAAGKTNPVLADELGMTVDGVKWHVSEMMGELGLANRQELAAWWRTERHSSSPGIAPAPLTRVRTALGGGAKIALTAVAVLAVMIAAYWAASRHDAAAPATATDNSLLAYVLVDASSGQAETSTSRLYTVAPGESPALVRTTRTPWTTNSWLRRTAPTSRSTTAASW
ncbi:MAG TPA: helix-turn-helix transcriptional regulator [Dehalococcoidia bacterium]